MFSTRTGSSKWHNILRPFKPTTEKHDKKEDVKDSEIILNFDKKYKKIIKYPYNETCYIEMINWLHSNSIGAIDIQFVMQEFGIPHSLFIAFENLDDALVFKIKYSV